VPLVIDQLVQRHPGLVFHVITADPVELSTHSLPQRHIELALGALPAAPPANVAAEVLFEDRQVVMAGIDSPLEHRRKLTLADLIDEHWVLPPPGSAPRRYIDEAFVAHGFNSPPHQSQSSTYRSSWSLFAA